MSQNLLPEPSTKLGMAITVRNSQPWNQLLMDQLVDLDRRLRADGTKLCVVISDDSSTDSTREDLLSRLARYPNLDAQVFTNSKRLGVMMNRYQALSKLPKDLTHFALLDGDTEEDARLVAELFVKLRNRPGAGGIVSTYSYSNHSILRRCSSLAGWFAVHLISLGKVIPAQSALRLYRAEHLEAFRGGLLREGSLAVSDAILPTQSIAFPINKSSKGASNFTRMDRLTHFRNLILNSPFLLGNLRMAAFLLIASSLSGLLLSVSLTGFSWSYPLNIPIILTLSLSVGILALIAVRSTQRKAHDDLFRPGADWKSRRSSN